MAKEVGTAIQVAASSVLSAHCSNRLISAAPMVARRVSMIAEHSFAIQSLLRWYRQGADVQSNLPKLAIYMGHVSIASTAYYLRWIPELAAAANLRFESHYGHLISGGAAE